MLEAAVDVTLEHSERPVVGNLSAGRYIDAAALRHDDASRLDHGNAASCRLELDDASPASVGQQRVEVIWRLLDLRYPRADRGGYRRYPRRAGVPR